MSYCVIPIPHKRFGMFATRDNVAGELVAVEQPSSHPARCFLPEEAYDEIGLQLPLMAMVNSRMIEECPNPVEGIL